MKTEIVTQTFGEGEFWAWHERFKAAGGRILRCFEIRGHRGLSYQVVYLWKGAV